MGFSDTLRAHAAALGLELQHPHHPEPLADLDYADELRLKNAALGAFWAEHALPGRPEPVVASPRPRGYRTTTKRRAIHRGGRLALGFPGSAVPVSGLAPSALDHPDHVRIYARLLPQLTRGPFRAVAAQLNHVIVRGSPGALSVIFNVRRLDAAVVRGARRLADDLRGAGVGVRAAAMVVDPTASHYYLEARRPATGLSGKRLFGPDWLEVDVDGVRLRFPLTAFSQVNSAMLPEIITTVRALLGPLDGRCLVDLYCGYGLFSLTVGEPAARLVGIDHDGPAIKAARRNAEHLGRSPRVRFVAGRIDGGFLRARLRPSREPEVVLLDPPSQGTAPGVAPAIAEGRPEQIVHLCCGADQLPREVAAWVACGQQVRRVVPLDMFAGTANLETLIQLAVGL